MFSLDDKVVVITGAASGVGRATALRFAEAGARLILADIQNAEELASQTNGKFVETDVRREADVKTLMEKAVATFGKLDVVINNAGILKVSEIKDITEEDVNAVFDVNYKGTLWGIKHSILNIKDGGVIINMASVMGLVGWIGTAIYGASKAAILQLTKTAALELTHRKIRVNAVCPGRIQTPMVAGLTDPELMEVEMRLHPLGRECRPEEVAAVYHFLASDDCTFMTGGAISLDGAVSSGVGQPILDALWERASMVADGKAPPFYKDA